MFGFSEIVRLTKNRCGLISLAAGLSDTNEKSPKSTGRLDLISTHEKVW